MNLNLNVEHYKTFENDVETYSGSVEDVPEAHFILSISQDEIEGQIALGNLVYEISFDPTEGRHIVIEVDLSSRSRSSPDPLGIQERKLEGKAVSISSMAGGSVEPKGTTGQATPMGISSPANGTVRILVLYANGMSGISALSANIITSLNDSLRNSGVDPDLYFSLAGTRQLAGDLNGLCRNDVIEGMENRTFPFVNIVNWINTYDADLVLTIAQTDVTITGCQLFNGAPDAFGNTGGQASDLLDENRPYAMVFDSYAMGDYTGAHEIGHLVGGGHSDWNMTFFAPAELYARGFVRSDLDWQSMMGAYPDSDQDPANDNGCEFLDDDCVRLLRWSDPGATNGGVTIGTATNDMVQALDVWLPDVADWTSYPGGTPSTPGGFMVQSQSCYGFNTITWSASSGTTEYQVFRSTSSSFSSPSLVYMGTSAGMSTNMSQGSPEYYKVRACNGNGCSSVTSSGVTTWYNGCY